MIIQSNIQIWQEKLLLQNLYSRKNCIKFPDFSGKFVFLQTVLAILLMLYISKFAFVIINTLEPFSIINTQSGLWLEYFVRSSPEALLSPPHFGLTRPKGGSAPHSLSGSELTLNRIK